MTKSSVTRLVAFSTLCIGAVLATACGGSPAANTPIPPTASASFAGNWQGSTRASFLSGWTLQLEISQSHADLTGR